MSVYNPVFLNYLKTFLQQLLYIVVVFLLYYVQIKDNVVNKINEKYKEVLNPLQNGTCIDIVPASVNKANGIYALLDVVGGKYEDVIAVGDNINDTHMIAEFRSYAMANGVDSIKALANVITESITDLIYNEM